MSGIGRFRIFLGGKEGLKRGKRKGDFFFAFVFHLSRGEKRFRIFPRGKATFIGDIGVQLRFSNTESGSSVANNELTLQHAHGQEVNGGSIRWCRGCWQRCWTRTLLGVCEEGGGCGEGPRQPS